MKSFAPPALSFPLEGDLTHSIAGARYAAVVDHLLARKNSSGQVLITSPGAGEGKTVTAVNLALAFHARKIPVLLVELSLRLPKFAEIFGPSPLPSGIEAVLTGKKPLAEVICRRNDNNLQLAMVNRRQYSDDLLAAGEPLDLALAQARKEFAWTILDGPSVSACEHLPSLAKSVGQVLLVARIRKTPQTAVQSAVSTIDHPQTMLLLNDE